MTRIDEILEEKRRELRELEVHYLHAKEYLKSDRVNADRLNALAKIEAIMKFNHTEQPEALWLMGRVAQVLADLREQKTIVDRYESLSRSITEAVERSS